MTALERCRQAFLGEPAQGHRGRWNAQPGELGRIPCGDALVGGEFLIKGRGVHFFDVAMALDKLSPT